MTSLENDQTYGVIKYLQKKEFSPKDIHIDVVAILGDYASALPTNKYGQLNLKRKGRIL